jgi:short-subunit dehydrogenase
MSERLTPVGSAAVFITGASSGIGMALARQYLEEGCIVGLLARRQLRLQSLVDEFGARARVYPVDIRDRLALHEAARNFLSHTSGVDIVIANAGVSAGTLTQHTEDFEVFKDIFDTNVLSMVSTFEPFIESMCARGQGTLVGVASVAGVRGLPGAGAYCASKSAVATYCESLRLELRPKGVSVVTIAPGYVESEMTAINPYRMPFILSANEFASRARRAIRQRRGYCVIPWQMSVLAKLMRLLPNSLYDRLAIDAPRKPRRKS